MDTIKAICHTNLDAYKSEEFPKEFVAVPNKGDYVESKTGKLLKVVQITHIFTKQQAGAIQYPYIRVELHK